MTSYRIAAAGAALLALGAAGCANVVTLTTEYHPEEMEWARTDGPNALAGQAIMRTRTGTTRSCVSLPVYLVPWSDYAQERMDSRFGPGVERGYAPSVAAPTRFTSEHPDYFDDWRETRCGSGGRFRFDDLPDGTYFVITAVTWQDRKYLSYEGGLLMLRVELAGGETERVVLAP